MAREHLLVHLWETARAAFDVPTSKGVARAKLIRAAGILPESGGINGPPQNSPLAGTVAVLTCNVYGSDVDVVESVRRIANTRGAGPIARWQTFGRPHDALPSCSINDPEAATAAEMITEVLKAFHHPDPAERAAFENVGVEIILGNDFVNYADEHRTDPFLSRESMRRRGPLIITYLTTDLLRPIADAVEAARQETALKRSLGFEKIDAMIRRGLDLPSRLSVPDSSGGKTKRTGRVAARPAPDKPKRRARKLDVDFPTTTALKRAVRCPESMRTTQNRQCTT